MPCGIEIHRIRTGQFCGVLIQILGKRASLAAKRVRGLKLGSMAAKLSVLTLFVMLIIGCVEQHPGPPSTKTTENEKILAAISDIKISQETATSKLTDKLSAMETSIKNDLDDIRSAQSAINEDILALKGMCENLIHENDSLYEKIDYLEEKLDYMENQSRRNNLLIHGIDSSWKDTWEEIESKVKEFFRTKLNLTDLRIERAHRVGNAIVVKFLSFKDRELVLSKAKLLRDVVPRISIRPDVSVTVRRKIQGLLDLKKSYQERKERAYIRHDKLVTPDGVFTFNLKKQEIEKAANRRGIDRRHTEESNTGQQFRPRHEATGSRPTRAVAVSQHTESRRPRTRSEISDRQRGAVSKNRRHLEQGSVSSFRQTGRERRRDRDSSSDSQTFRDDVSPAKQWC